MTRNQLCDQRALAACQALQPMIRRFADRTALVLAPGRSLPGLVLGLTAEHPTIAVNDAWREFSSSDILYATDHRWWVHHKGVAEFRGFKVGYQTTVRGVLSLQASRSCEYDPRLGYLWHGHNSGHAAAHLAAQLGARRIVLVGFDWDGSHFFGDHPKEIRVGMNWSLSEVYWATLRDELADRGVDVRNGTPGSRLKVFEPIGIDEILQARAA